MLTSKFDQAARSGSNVFSYQISSSFENLAGCSQLAAQFSGDIVGRVTPVPIPNTEVKPTGADDTASFRCGKVGSRRDYFKNKPRSI